MNIVEALIAQGVTSFTSRSIEGPYSFILRNLLPSVFSNLWRFSTLQQDSVRAGAAGLDPVSRRKSCQLMYISCTLACRPPCINRSRRQETRLFCSQWSGSHRPA